MTVFVACLQAHAQGENGRFSYTIQPNTANHVYHWGLAAAESERLVFVGRGVIWNWFSDHPTDSECFWRRFCDAYERRGVGFLRQLDGQFAFALFDKQTETLYAFRDPLGYYPLYLLRERGKTAVSSHFKPLCQRKTERQIAPEAALFFIQAGYLVGGSTLVKDIERVLPGEFIMVTGDNRLTRERYWTYPAFAPEPQKTAVFIEEAHARMNDALNRNLDGYEHVALFLSGGVDSTVLAGMLAQRPHIHTTAYNFGLNIANERVDYLRDSAYARLVAEQHQLAYRECRLDRRFPIVEALWALLPTLDSPLMSPNVMTKGYMLAEAARVGKTAVVTGSAAFIPFSTILDEEYETLKRKTGATDPVELALLDSVRTRKSHIVRQLFPDFEQTTQEELLALVAPYLDVGSTQNDRERFELGVTSLYLTEKTVSIHHLVGDQVGMVAKMPFFDTQWAQFRARTPRSLRGAGRCPNKYLLIKAFEHLIPPAVLTRPKAGFPSYYWHRGELAQLQKHLFSNEVLTSLPFLSPQGLRELVAAEKESTRKSAGKLTWGIMIFVMWYLHFVLEWELDDIVGC